MYPTQTKRVRKGTKSCTECRRRKIRCIPSYDGALACRRCEETGFECIPQTSRAQRSGLRRQISPIAPKPSQQVDGAHEIADSHVIQSLGPPVDASNGSTDSRHSLRGCAVKRPSHLQFLFQNNWLRMTQVPDSLSPNHPSAKGSTQLLNTARVALQRLIPPEVEVYRLADRASPWLPALYSLFPLPFAAKSQEELVSVYEEMKTPNVEPMQLASWLLSLSFVVEQLHQDELCCGGLEQWPTGISNEISDVVKMRVLAHDTLLSSIRGLSVSLQFIRLQLGRGNIHEAWVNLRRVIAVAELMGLPRLAEDAPREINADSGTHEVQLWSLICAADGLLGMLLNVPSIIRCHHETTPRLFCIDGVVQTRNYFYHLTRIATKIQHLDHLCELRRANAEASSFASMLSRELQILASRTPEAWWVGAAHGALGLDYDRLVQLLHFYIALRVHLPVALRQSPSSDGIHSHTSCIDACQSLVQRYLLLGQSLPAGLFLSEMIDFQVFTAAGTLLLLSHTPCLIDSMGAGMDQLKMRYEVGRVIAALQRKALNNTPGSGSAKDQAHALCVLGDVLERGNQGANESQRDVYVPLLGGVHIRRLTRVAPAGRPRSLWASQVPGALGISEPNEQFLPLMVHPDVLNVSSFDGDSWGMAPCPYSDYSDSFLYPEPLNEVVSWTQMV
ncbi:hypothetical protein BJX65DRAFT_286246 [Aspergillus insuetus]